MKYQHSMMLGQSSYPKDDTIRTAQAGRGRESTCTKQQQGNACATKAYQDLPVNVVINSQLLVCKAYG
jgi:hypothetical protein